MKKSRRRETHRRATETVALPETREKPYNGALRAARPTYPMKSRRVVLIILLLAAIISGLSWKFWLRDDATSSTRPIAPMASKVTVAPKSASTLVEAPKVAPAPVHDAPVAQTVSDPKQVGVAWHMSGPSLGNPADAVVATANTPDAQRAKLAALIAAKRTQMEAQRKAIQAAIDNAAADAKGDPSEMVKIDAMRQQLDVLMQTKQQEINDLEAQTP